MVPCTKLGCVCLCVCEANEKCAKMSVANEKSLRQKEKGSRMSQN